MRVLIIPEDFRKDQHVLKPIVTAILQQLGRSRATVLVCRDPLLGGVGQALKWERIEEIIERYRGMTDLFLLCIDRDGDQHRHVRLDAITTRATGLLPQRRGFFAAQAWQEVEVWLLAGHDLPARWIWKQVRDDLDPKERYYLPFAAHRGLVDAPAEGRATLGAESARRYSRIRQLCPEVAELEGRIAQWLRQEP